MRFQSIPHKLGKSFLVQPARCVTNVFIHENNVRRTLKIVCVPDDAILLAGNEMLSQITH
jgi:hypothetical protein